MGKEKVSALTAWRQQMREEREVFDGSPRLDVQGDRRVVVENHHGLRQYSEDCMQVAVKGGAVRIWGEGLELAVMNRSDLVIAGHIRGLEFVP